MFTIEILPPRSNESQHKYFPLFVALIVIHVILSRLRDSFISLEVKYISLPASLLFPLVACDVHTAGTLFEFIHFQSCTLQ